MHAFDVLGDPVRRRLLELLTEGEAPAGSLTDVVRREFGISQPAVSQHLRVLREHGFVVQRPEGARRWYRLPDTPAALHEVDDWLGRIQRHWGPRLDALETEVARGKRARRRRTNP